MASKSLGEPVRFAGQVVVVLVATALVAQGAITWSSIASVTTGTATPPIHLEKGDNADDNRWFKSFSLSTNQTSFTAEVKPRAGGKVHIKDVASLTSTDDESRSVTLTGSQVSDVEVEQFRWTIHDGSTKKATLDHKQANPSATVTLPAGSGYRMDLEIDLVQGAGKVNAGIDFTVQMEVS